MCKNDFINERRYYSFLLLLHYVVILTFLESTYALMHIINTFEFSGVPFMSALTLYSHRLLIFGNISTLHKLILISYFVAFAAMYFPTFLHNPFDFVRHKQRCHHISVCSFLSSKVFSTKNLPCSLI